MAGVCVAIALACLGGDPSHVRRATVAVVNHAQPDDHLLLARSNRGGSEVAAHPRGNLFLRDCRGSGRARRGQRDHGDLWNVGCARSDSALGARSDPWALARGAKRARYGWRGCAVGVFIGQDRKCRAVGSRLGHHRKCRHTSELQSPCNLVCRLLLEKKKKKNLNHCSEIKKKTKKTTQTTKNQTTKRY